jgi:hypothetical protein
MISPGICNIWRADHAHGRAEKNGKATLHACSYRRRRTGCFYFGLGFNG